MKYIFLLALISSIFLLGGCGGSTLGDASTLPKGEGNIPIGCVDNRVLEGSRVVITKSNGSKYETKVVGGTIYTPRLPNGPCRIDLYPIQPSYQRETISFIAGAEQRFVTELAPLTQNLTVSKAQITSSIVEGQTFHIGDVVDLGVSVRLFLPVAFHPTIFVSGGIGSITEENQFKATSVGTGQIRIKVSGTIKAVSVQVVQ